MWGWGEDSSHENDLGGACPFPWGLDGVAEEQEWNGGHVQVRLRNLVFSKKLCIKVECSQGDSVKIMSILDQSATFESRLGLRFE